MADLAIRAARRLASTRRQDPLSESKDADVETAYDDEDQAAAATQTSRGDAPPTATHERTRTIAFDPAADNHPKNNETLYIPGPRDRDHGVLLLSYHLHGPQLTVPRPPHRHVGQKQQRQSRW